MERWKLSLGTSAAERRIVLRQARDNGTLPADNAKPGDSVSELPSVARVLDASRTRGAANETDPTAARETTDAAGVPERTSDSACPDDAEGVDDDDDDDTDDGFDVFEDA
ncbi:Uncharacterised protein [Mycobacteroides abscessus subsp. abscessus]|nr:Uncharacterised protein [Mycobacteroides abscessus subsp. abscessus]